LHLDRSFSANNPGWDPLRLEVSHAKTQWAQKTFIYSVNGYSK